MTPASAARRYARTRFTRFLRGSSVPTNSRYGSAIFRRVSVSATSVPVAGSEAASGTTWIRSGRTFVVEVRSSAVFREGVMIASARRTAARSPLL